MGHENGFRSGSGRGVAIDTATGWVDMDALAAAEPDARPTDEEKAALQLRLTAARGPAPPVGFWAHVIATAVREPRTDRPPNPGR
ncbi:hypothetical protein [Embleya hyalina]|uniref:Uncharacterized protein n=1 Tax=Embleya hyalina TaxID=516124 RepID=A0A401YMI9_9ACTN|nr:hypothetical protein [Embleya hyalina]GCD95816.1 hypothetical protein EHYA_03499 [Embleya hyalina]